MYRPRDFQSDNDLRLMQEVVAETWRAEKPLVQFHVGDLAWARYQHAGREHEWRIRLWETFDGRAVGWAWLSLPNELQIHASPEHRHLLLPELLEWVDSQASVARADLLT